MTSVTVEASREHDPRATGMSKVSATASAETDDLQGGTTVKARRLFLAVAAAAALGIAVGAGSAGSERSSEGCGSKLVFSCGRRVTRRFPGLPSSRRSGTPTSRSTGASTPATTWPPPGHGSSRNTALRDNARGFFTACANYGDEVTKGIIAGARDHTERDSGQVHPAGVARHGCRTS